MPLNVGKMRELQGQLKNSGGGSSDLFLYSSKLTEETDVRILPPTPQLEGAYFIKQINWWVNGKGYTSYESFGESCPITEEYLEAKNSGDPDLIALLQAKKNNRPVVKKEITYLVPILHLNCKWDAADNLESFDLFTGKARVLVAKPSLLSAINVIVTSRHFQNGTEDGITDRVQGHNLSLSKTGAGLDTVYDAQGWPTPMEMPEQYYMEDFVPDVVAILNKGRKSEAHLRSVIRNYLYGEPIVEEPKEDSTPTATKPSKPTATKASKPTATKTAKPSRPSKSKAKTNIADAANSYAEDLDSSDLDNLD